MKRKGRPKIDREERCENVLRPSRYLGYNRDELGLYFTHRGADKIAESQFRRAVWLNPFEPDFKIHLAYCLFRQSRFVEAEEWARQALCASPGQKDAEMLLRLIESKVAEISRERSQ